MPAAHRRMYLQATEQKIESYAYQRRDEHPIEVIDLNGVLQKKVEGGVPKAKKW